VGAPDDSGKFTTEIPKEVMDAAMDAVDKREKKARGKKGDDEVEIDVATSPHDAREVRASAAKDDDETTQVSPDHTPGSDPQAAEIDQLKAQLDFSLAKGRELTGKIKDEHEKMLRAVADLENYKKRAAKEKDEMQKFGIEKLMRDFLPVIDNFDRALEQKNLSDVASLKTGVEMIKKLFEDALAKHGVKPFVAMNKPFDPNFHEAMGQIESKDLPPNHVGNELVRGFTLHERLLRPALVMVTRAPADAKPEAAEAKPAAEAPPSDGEEKK
jgi:molecular chaperone GrpE